jgi:integrase
LPEDGLVRYGRVRADAQGTDGREPTGGGASVKRTWTEEELIERWTLAPDELPLLKGKAGPTRLGFAVMLRFFAGEGRFPDHKAEVPGQAVSYLGRQVGVPAEEYLRYDWGGRSIKYHRAEVRRHFGFREPTEEDARALARWLLEEVLPRERDREKLRARIRMRCREAKVEPPSPGRIERLIASASRAYHERFCDGVFSWLSPEALRSMDALLETGPSADAPEDDPPGAGRSGLSRIKADPGRVGLESVLEEIGKLGRVREVGLPDGLFSEAQPKLVDEYRRRAATEAPSELRAHRPAVRATLAAALCWSRQREITDSLVDLLVQLVQRMGARAERDRALLLVLYAGALRREEAAGLKWRDLTDRPDLGPGVGQLAVFGKGGKTGVVAIPAEAHRAILALRTVAEPVPGGGRGQKREREAAPDEPIFRSRKRRNASGGHLDVSALNRVVSKAARRAGLRAPVSPHWLRHAHASHAHARGTDLALIRDTLRHSNIGTTSRYLHARPNDSSGLHLGL